MKARQNAPKRCYSCGEELPITALSPDRSQASGYTSLCRPCDLAKSRAYYEANREPRRAYYEANRERILANTTLPTGNTPDETPPLPDNRSREW